MANALQDYLLEKSPQVVAASLQGVVGKPASYVTNEAHYRQHVIRKGWEALPVAVRMLFGKQYQRWDILYLALRPQVFDLGGGTIALRPEAPARVAAALRNFFGAANPSPAGPPSPRPPLATPVGPSHAVPMALPVEPAGLPTRAAPAGGHRTNGTLHLAAVAVGIDLGTTYSLVAHVDPQGRPCCLPNAAGDLLTPSVVLFDEGGAVVGKEAVQASAMEPEKVAECVKRDMGAKVYRKKINGEYLPPEVISSMILRNLKADAERRLGPVHKAVITVPAYFEDTRRRATLDAGRLAGLEVLDILNEPTAAAIAYGYQLGFLDAAGQLRNEQALRVLVYDLGGGTFDVTLLEIRGKVFKALATDGDVGLGGKDWDDKLVEIAAGRFRQQFREDPRDNPVSLQELRLSDEAAKRTLSERARAALFVNHLGSRLKVEITRQEFEDATRPLLERTRMTVEIVLRQAGLTWAGVDRLLLVGGSTRMPMVGRMLEELSGKTPDRSISPDEAVAQGAALYAALLARQSAAGGNGAVAPAAAPFAIENVNSHSLGVLGTDVRTGRKVNKVLIPKNSSLPRTVSKVFRTFKPHQRSVGIRVLEGESTRPEVCSQVGLCAIRDLPPGLPVGWPVRISYTYQTNGRLHVTARVKGCARGVTTDFLCANAMPDEDLNLWMHYIDEEVRGRESPRWRFGLV
jgi:molecular chaperone DnaK